MFTVAMASTTEVPAGLAGPGRYDHGGRSDAARGRSWRAHGGIAAGGGDGEGAYQPASESEIATMPEVDTDACGKTIAYPDEAEQAGVEGDVRLRVSLSPEGRVYAVRVLSGLGHGLDRAAMEALKHRCRFSPAIGKAGKAGRLRHPVVHVPFSAPALSPAKRSCHPLASLIRRARVCGPIARRHIAGKEGTMADVVENLNGAVVVADGGSAHPRVSWGAVFAGAVAAVGLWMLLYAFGLAVGASTLNVQDAGSAKATGIFTGIWGAVAPLIALFIGGIVAGRGRGVDRRGDGALHGFVTWALAAIGGAFLLANLVGAIAGGVASVGKSAAKAAGGAGASGPQIEQAMRSAGIDANDLVRPVNERLRAQGLPAVSPPQMEAVARDVLQRSVRTGAIDQQVIVQSVADNTSLSRSDAQQVAGQLQSQLQTARGQLMNEVQSAADAAGKALWGAFIALALGLIAAIVGGLVGVPGLRRRPQRREPRARSSADGTSRAGAAAPRSVSMKETQDAPSGWRRSQAEPKLRRHADQQ